MVLSTLMLYDYQDRSEDSEKFKKLAEEHGINFELLNGLVENKILSFCENKGLHLLVVHCATAQRDTVYNIARAISGKQDNLRILFCSSSDPQRLRGVDAHPRVGRSIEWTLSGLPRYQAFKELLGSSDTGGFDRQFNCFATIVPPHYLSAALVAVLWLGSQDKSSRNDKLKDLRAQLGETFWNEASNERGIKVLDDGWEALEEMLAEDDRLTRLASEIEKLVAMPIADGRPRREQ